MNVPAWKQQFEKTAASGVGADIAKARKELSAVLRQHAVRLKALIPAAEKEVPPAGGTQMIVTRRLTAYADKLIEVDSTLGKLDDLVKMITDSQQNAGAFDKMKKDLVTGKELETKLRGSLPTRPKPTARHSDLIRDHVVNGKVTFTYKITPRRNVEIEVSNQLSPVSTGRATTRDPEWTWSAHISPGARKNQIYGKSLREIEAWLTSSKIQALLTKLMKK